MIGVKAQSLKKAARPDWQGLSQQQRDELALQAYQEAFYNITEATCLLRKMVRFDSTLGESDAQTIIYGAYNRSRQ